MHTCTCNYMYICHNVHKIITVNASPSAEQILSNLTGKMTLLTSIQKRQLDLLFLLMKQYVQKVLLSIVCVIEKRCIIICHYFLHVPKTRLHKQNLNTDNFIEFLRGETLQIHKLRNSRVVRVLVCLPCVG